MTYPAIARILPLVGLLGTPAAAATKRAFVARPTPIVAAPAQGGAQREQSGLIGLVDRTSGNRPFKAYLKRRLGTLREQQKARLEFLEKEAELSKAFSTRLHGDREAFESRIVRQLEDMFESLSSLESSDRSTALADVERTQTSLVKLFEAQQGQKATDFFAARETRWKEFAARMERERAEFVVRAPADWQAAAGAASPAERVPEAGASQSPRRAQGALDSSGD